MLVERIERPADGLRIYGRFDRLDGVRGFGYFRFARRDYAWAELKILDRSTCEVLVTDSRDPEVGRLRTGERYIWLDDYWQAPLVEAIADETHMWRRFTFVPADARQFKQGDAIGWQPLGQALPKGAIDLGIKPKGWDHEHCGLCDGRIDPDAPIGYTDNEGHFLCPPCYKKYGAPHDVSFQVGA